MRCCNCSGVLPENAQFCPQCGARLVYQKPLASLERRGGMAWKRMLGSILLSLGLSCLLIGVFHWPIFILGIGLPFWGWAVPKRKDSR